MMGKPFITSGIDTINTIINPFPTIRLRDTIRSMSEVQYVECSQVRV